jgi:hypothetical protein
MLVKEVYGKSKGHQDPLSISDVQKTYLASISQMLLATSTSTFAVQNRIRSIQGLVPE